MLLRAASIFRKRDRPFSCLYFVVRMSALACFPGEIVSQRGILLNWVIKGMVFPEKNEGTSKVLFFKKKKQPVGKRLYVLYLFLLCGPFLFGDFRFSKGKPETAPIISSSPFPT